MQEIWKKLRVLSGEMWMWRLHAFEMLQSWYFGACVLCYHDHRVVVVCAPTIVSWRLLWLFVLRPSCRGDAGRRCGFFVKCLQVPREALEIAGTLINFRSGKFGYSICPFFSKGHAKIFREFWHDSAKKGTYGVLRLMHGPGYPST